MSEILHTKKTSPEQTGQNVRILQSTNKLTSRQENFSQVFDISIFEVKDGMVNLTKICQNFGKEFSNWNKTKSTKEFLFEFARENPDLPNGGIAILKGGNGEQGTFAVREIAIELARWISPKFAVWTNKQIDTLFQTGKVEIQVKTVQDNSNFSTLDILKLATKEIEKLDLELTQTKIQLQHKQEIILETVAKVPVQEIRTKLNKICRWTKQGDFQYRWRLLYKEFYYTHHKNLKELADNAEMKILDYAEKFGYLENLYNLALKLFETEREGELLILN